MSTPINQPLIDQLRGLWGEVNAKGGATTDNAFNNGFCLAIGSVLTLLERHGFEEGKSTAASEIEALNAEIAKLRGEATS